MTGRKRRSLVAMGSVLLLLAAACREEAPTGGGGGGGEPTPEVTTLKEGVLTVGTTLPYAPFEYGPTDNLKGLDVEIIDEIAKRLGGLETEWVDTPFGPIFSDLAAGQFDVVIGGITITPEREKQVNFADPYFRSLQALTVQEGSGISSFDDLGEGDTVSVQTGTTGEMWAEENLAANQGVEVRAFEAYPAVYNALEAGQVDGVVFDESSAIPETFNRPGLEVVDTVDTNEFYGIAVDPNNEDLLDAINEAQADMIEDGTYDRIFDSFPDCTEQEVKSCLVPGGRITAQE